MSKKYYWLKLKHDFFEQQEVRIIEQMPSGKDYVLFYLKLLCKSVTTEGKLRFNEQIPYDEEMLSVITNTDAKIVHEAVKVFEKFHLMEILDDGTYFMHEVEKMMGSETYWAQKKREQRSREDGKLDNSWTNSNVSPTCPTKRESIDKEQELDREGELDPSLSPNKKFTLESGWDYTLGKYPRKTNLGNAHELWLEMVTRIPGAEKETAKEICDAVELFADDYHKNNSDDPEGKFVIGFERWLKEESAVWIKRLREIRERVEAAQKALENQEPVYEGDDW